MSAKTCPNCGYDISVHEMFSPPMCPVVRIRWDDPPRTFLNVTPPVTSTDADPGDD